MLTAHPQILYVLNMDSANVKATSLATLNVGGKETLKVEAEVVLVRQMLSKVIIKTKELAIPMLTARPRILCVLNMVSASVKATSLVTLNVGGRETLKVEVVLV